MPTQTLLHPKQKISSQALQRANTPVSGSQLDPDFINHCQQELAEFIGPIAAIVCHRTLAQNPKFSAMEFVEALAKHISNQQQAVEFQQRLLP